MNYEAKNITDQLKILASFLCVALLLSGVGVTVQNTNLSFDTAEDALAAPDECQDPPCGGSGEGSNPATCEDADDNDNDGKIDYPNDPECDSKTDGSETPLCDDGEDNDSDGYTDYPEDPSCSSVNDDEEAPNDAACGDGTDNDDDGFADLNDPECSDRAGNSESPANSFACSDGTDNDSDGYTDTNDPSCSGQKDDSESPVDNPGCNDGTDNDDDGFTDHPDDPDCSSETDSETKRNLDQYCNWQQVDSTSKMVSCTPPDDETSFSDPGTIYSANGNSEYLKVWWRALASTASCGDGGSCKADGDSVFDADAFGQPTKTLSAQAKVKCAKGKGNCSGTTDTVNKYSYSPSNPSGSVSMNTSPYSPGCNADYGADSSAGYNVEVYKCVPKSNTCTTGSFSHPKDPLGQNGGSTGCETTVKYLNGPEQVELCIIEVEEENDGGAVIPKKIKLAVDGAGDDFNDGQKSTTTISVADFKAGKQTIEGRDFKLTDDPGDPDPSDTGSNEHAIADKSGDWVMDIKHYACGGGGSNDDPEADSDGTIDAGICADSSGKSIDVLDNDSDPDGDPLSVVPGSVEDPVSTVDGDVNGSTYLDPMTGEIIYTPAEAPDTVEFEYTISDANGGTDTATVTVNVTGDESSCGPLTVRVEDPDGNLVPGVGFKPKYDEDNNGQPEQLPEKGFETGKFTYNVTVDDDPSLSKMNQGLLTQIPSGFATSVEEMKKAVEKTDTPSGPKDEPDDHTYQNVTNKKSKLATDPDGGDNGGGDNSPNAVLSCSGSQDQTFGQDCIDQYGQDAFAAKFDASGSTDPDNDIDTYDWSSQSGNIATTTDHPDADIKYCVNTASQSDTQDTVVVEVTDDEGNSDSASKQIGDMCPFGGDGGGCSEVSVQDDFSGDNLDVAQDSWCSGEEGSARYCEPELPPESSEAELSVDSVLSPGDSAGDLVVEFLNDFEAGVGCTGAQDPSDCMATAEITSNLGSTREISVSGSDSNPDPFLQDKSDYTVNVSRGDTISLETTAQANLGRNREEYRSQDIEAWADINVTDIKLEVCN